MTAQRCRCGHYRFAHDKAADRCDDCGCQRYWPCSMCDGLGHVQIAPVSTVADWSNAQMMPCPRCADAT